MEVETKYRSLPDLILFAILFFLRKNGSKPSFEHPFIVMELCNIQIRDWEIDSFYVPGPNTKKPRFLERTCDCEGVLDWDNVLVGLYRTYVE